MPKRDAHEFVELFGAVSRRWRGMAADAYAAFEVGPTQAKFLRHIGENARISQAELARATDTAPTLTGRALETLVERGWVSREQNEQDRRQYVLELTASGKRMRDKVVEARAGIVERVTAALDDRDIEDFQRIGHKLLEALRQES